MGTDMGSGERGCGNENMFRNTGDSSGRMVL